jgi:integrase
MSLRFSSVSRAFLRWAEQCRSPITVSVYAHYFRRFRAECGDKDVRRLTPAQLTAWAKTWHQSQAIVRLLRWCVKDARLFKTNPIEHVQHPPKGQRVRLLTAKEDRAILAACDVDLRALLQGYRDTMARPGELRAATWADVYPRVPRKKLRGLLRAGKCIIVLRDYKNRKTRRLPNEPRVILISPSAGRLLCSLLRANTKDTDHIFRTKRGKPWSANALRCRMRRLRKKINIVPDARGETIVPYHYRHRGATELTAAGIRDRMLADILGHTEVSTTTRYQHLNVDHLRAALRMVWKKQRPRKILSCLTTSSKPSR